MPIVDCLKSVEVKRTPRLLQLEGLFDVPPSQRSERRFHIDLPIENLDWSIGLIVGPSGSGKSTIAREAFGQNLVSGYAWPNDLSLVDAFPRTLSIKEITGLLSSVGFSSPPSWIRPFRCLSTGEQFRATLARAMAESSRLAVIDEFTSSLDRTVAQIGSAALAKFVRSNSVLLSLRERTFPHAEREEYTETAKRQFVAVTCHYDVVDWLDPDWVLEMPDGEFTRRSLRGRPTLTVEIARVHRSAWRLFRHHHYLDASLHKSAKCFVASYGGRPAAFASCLYHPSRGGGHWREHRTVCLPDFQGVGLGNALSEFVASLMIAGGKAYRSTTGSPAMVRHRCGSPHWRLLRKPSLTNRNDREWNKGFQFARSRALARFTAGFEYIGPARAGEAKRLAN